MAPRQRRYHTNVMPEEVEMPIIKTFALLIVCLLLTGPSLPSQEKGTSGGAPDPAQVEAVTKWLSGNVIPLKTVEAGHGFADLQPLKKVLKSARLVGLGEATHGSREFFQMKHRMLEFLVKEMGFNATLTSSAEDPDIILRRSRPRKGP